jgi:type VI protein secretion system component Hcp
MAKAPKGAKGKKALAVKDLTVKDAKTVKGGKGAATTTLMNACASGQHLKEATL